MNITASNDSQLQEILIEEVREMTLLARLLDLEQKALINNTPIQLEELTVEKNVLLGLLAELAVERINVLKKINTIEDEKEILQYFEHKQTPELTKSIWKELLLISSSAQEKNRTNGLLINRHINLTQNKLNILQKTNTNETMYGSDGQSKTTPITTRGYVVG